MERQQAFGWTDILQAGGIGGIVLLYLSLVGMVENFAGRDVIAGTLTLGLTLIISTNFILGYLVARRAGRNNQGWVVLGGLLSGLISSTMLAALALLIEPLNLRWMLVNASPGLIEVLTFGAEKMISGLAILVGLGAASSMVGAVIYLLPTAIARLVITGLVAIIGFGVLEELVSDVIGNIFKLISGNSRNSRPFLAVFFGREGLSVAGTGYIFLISVVFASLPILFRRVAGRSAGQIYQNLSRSTRLTTNIVGVVVSLGLILVLPSILGSYLSEILVTVAIFTLMGFGLNIVVGFAGLLDLGYVAFFAIGAYVMALLTSTGLPQTTDISGPIWSFWEALPVAVGVAVLWGVVLGIPVLRMRGDYLAIVTLGFGEIIRLLAISNFLQPYIGGAQGILAINRPVVFGYELITSQDLFYVVILACIVAAFISWRLRDARAGRNWMAMREDEDVAEAMGINLIATKLMAFGMGAGLSGLAGAIFATKLGSIYPHSFNLLISVNVLSLIIVGGIGSLPGVVVGALVLVGLPELLREFSEFRLLIFGALLVAMMLFKPEGLWPAAAQRRELHAGEAGGSLSPTPPSEEVETAS